MANDVSIWVRVRDGFTTNLKRAGASFKKMAGDVLTSAKTYAAGFAVVTGAIIASVAQFRQFNKEMARVEGLLGGVRADGLRREIMGLSAEIGTAHTQLTDGLYNALSAGIPKDNAIEFLRKTAKAAAVDGSELSVVVDGVTTVINAFGLEANDTEKAANAMFSAVAAGKTTMGEISAQLAMVAPNAAAAGVSFNEVFAALANMTAQGTKTSVAVTQIAAGIKGANDVLGDGWSATMNLNEAFEAMSQKANGLQSELTNLLGRKEAVNAVLANTGDNADRAAAAFARLEAGTEDLGDIFEGTTKQALAFDRLMNSIKNQFLDAGGAIDGSISPAIDGLAEGLERSRKGLDGNTQASDSLVKSLLSNPMLSGGFVALGTMIKDWTSLAEAVDQARGSIEKLSDVPDPDMSFFESMRKEFLDDVDTIEENHARAEKKKRDEAENTVFQLAKMDKLILEAREKADQEEVDSFLRKEEKKLEIAEQKGREMAGAVGGFAQDAANAAARAANQGADQGLFLNTPDSFAKRLKDFQERRKAAGEGARDDEAIEKRLQRIAEKEGRGIKISREDRKFREDVNALREAEKVAKDKRNEALQVQRDIKDLLQKNLQAAPGPA